MRFVTFARGGAVRAGVLDQAGGTVLDLGHPAFHDIVGPEPTVLDLIRTGLDVIETRLSGVVVPADARLPLEEVRLLAPLRPGRIIGAAHNFRDAVAERKMSPPEKPVTFVKEPSAVAGPTDTIVLPAGVGGVTYEAELAAVIGRRADAVSEGDALSHVAGYCVLNDVSASDVIRADGHFRRGKNFPTFCPMGPALVSASEVPDPQALRVRLWMDGVRLQDGTTADMLFSVATLISTLSAEHPLEPGDVIATGTPAGVAPVRNPPTWLRPGAVLETEVEGLGRLVNPIVEQ
ncbi:fumarylacetoacetate hydrolase family protein [Rhodoplanes roseus]|uniref:Fumarylacetoacetate hydrolase n=1 Tax=Rhodoplanes roseus TaxID=29409 RepID=A0A327KYZ8_9BRAD|nr:fumarylacetoacetate hydrolase family protein [Rhodoplanes roseus]RAI42903.1 fumarylacetoacetate hydrolase [Rhodoplanes roseus]